MTITTRVDGAAGLGGGAAAVAAVGAAAFLLGGATSLLQSLPLGDLAPLANSSSGWTLFTVLLVAPFHLRPIAAACAGALAFLLLVLGYTAVSTLRGFPTSEEVFLVAAVVVGPFVGWSASRLRGRDRAAAVGVGMLAGVGLGDGAFGLTHLVADTGAGYWIAIAALAVGLLVAVLVRVRRPLDRVIGGAVAVAVAGVMTATMSLL